MQITRFLSLNENQFLGCLTAFIDALLSNLSNRSLTVAARKPLLSRARQQAVPNGWQRYSVTGPPEVVEAARMACRASGSRSPFAER
ncbi:MAG: hypothetical protein HY235_00325 [Acidobacteria bacterium]|nr:hypothetical protein [Acidobacteriota bacterium]